MQSAEEIPEVEEDAEDSVEGEVADFYKRGPKDIMVVTRRKMFIIIRPKCPMTLLTRPPLIGLKWHLSRITPRHLLTSHQCPFKTCRHQYFHLSPLTKQPITAPTYFRPVFHRHNHRNPLNLRKTEANSHRKTTTLNKLLFKA